MIDQAVLMRPVAEGQPPRLAAPGGDPRPALDASSQKIQDLSPEFPLVAIPDPIETRTKRRCAIARGTASRPASRATAGRWRFPSSPNPPCFCVGRR
jgi:hypothetical protein